MNNSKKKSEDLEFRMSKIEESLNKLLKMTADKKEYKSSEVKKNETTKPGNCYKCGEPGHYTKECTMEGIFCYGCKTPGVIRPECPNCKPEN